MELSETGAAPEQQEDINEETIMNLALLDPPGFGWSATGGIVNVLPPHERARRMSTREAHVKLKRGRERRKERLEARKKKEAPPSVNIFRGADPLTGRIMMQATTVGSGPKPPPTQRLVPKDPPTHFVNGGSVWQQKVAATPAPPTAEQAPPTAAVAPSVSTGTAEPPTHAGSVQQSIPNGIQAAAQGITAAAAGLASFLMNKGANAISSTGTTTPPQAKNTAVSNTVESQPQCEAEPAVAKTKQSGSASNLMSADSITAASVDTANVPSTEATSPASCPTPTVAAAPSTSNMMEAAATSVPIEKTIIPTEAKQSEDKGINDNVVRVRALNQDGVLDMYTYHRGREGMEPRDEETGYLLCDVEPTDTNHGWEPPSMKLSINISFPLTSGDGETYGSGEPHANDALSGTRQTRRQSQAQKHNSGVHFRETVEWDLADPKTKTPLCFATEVAEEFGLSTDQTLALAESIQTQINYFVQNKVSYKSPLTLLDANGVERGSAASVHSPDMRGPPQLYGSVVGETKAGMPIPQKLLLQTTKTVRLLGSSSREPISVDEPASDSPPTIEPMYREEVFRRARKASSEKMAEKWPNGVVGVMETEEDGVCHVCRKTKQTWHLACGNKYHALCSRHLETMVGISLEDGDDPILVDFCPICDFRCSCRNCTRRLSSAAANLRSKYVDEGLTPEQISFDDLFQPRLAAIASKREKRTSAKIEWSQTVRTTVPKVPASDFPREVCAGCDVDPGTKDDYRTVYTAEGAFLQTDAPSYTLDAKMPPAVPENVGVLEDGNVDYCHTCLKAGNLLCCDFCPRAFHPECIPADEPIGGDDAWECMICRKEKEPTDDDVLTGESSLDRVCATFVPSDHSDGIDTCVQVLSVIHETVSKLIEYDFGFMFREPVDCEAIPTYKAIKNPMDLGTISSRILNGEYLQKFKQNESWDDVLVAVLQDIELVWHNCFIFNFDGSSVYRMAEVQRRKYLNIRKRSFDHLLSPETKRRVDEYVRENDETRRKFRAKTTSDRRANGRNKITVSKGMRKTNRTVAVLDPDSGLIVKMYSTFKGAVLAAQFLRGLGHDMEVSSLNEPFLRKLVQSSVGDPKLLLFGYRWFYFEDLLSGKVKFGSSVDKGATSGSNDTSPPCTVEFKIGEESFVFLSIEEAISWPDMPGGMPLAEVRQKLFEIPFDEWTTIGQLSCRKLKQVGHESEDSGENGDSARAKQCLLVDVSKYPFPTNVGFVKEDLITRRALAGFESANAAHADWLATRQTSPVCPLDEPTDLDYFKKYYLDGERNINGIIWRTTRANFVPDNGKGSASNAVHQGVSNSLKGETENETSDGRSHESGVENVSQSTDSGSRTMPANGVRNASAALLPSMLQGYSKLPNPLNGGLSPLRSSNGNLLGAKRKHESDTLVTNRASKKTAVSTAS